jgi:hypothetical protein
MKRTHFVYLTGGLGNQLFQLAAALDLAKASQGKVVIDTVIGKPRMTNDQPDIIHFKVPEEIRFFSRRSNVVSAKSAGFLLRMGIRPVGLERNELVRKIMKFAGGVVLSLRFRRILGVNLAEDVGFQNLKLSRSSILLGYFQSYRYLENVKVRESLEGLEPIHNSIKLLTMIESAREQKPIFVHVRLSDYLEEKNFGTPQTQYYYRALKKLKGETRKIWIFSDDIILAQSRMPPEFRSNYCYVDDSGFSPAQLLHLLRFGQDYVIANSSFSWWGAALAFNKDSTVIAPEPWFAGMPEPKDLIPTNWHREKA